MSKNQKYLVVVFTTFFLSAIAGWVSGYNFNERGPGVAIWVLCTSFIAWWMCLGVAWGVFWEERQPSEGM